MSTIVVGEYVLPVVAEDPKKPTSLYISQPLRQAAYNILGLGTIRESMRDGLSYVSVEVPTYTITCEGQTITLDVIPMLKFNSKKKIFYYFLRCNIDLIDLLNEKWRLAIASVIFWAHSTNTSLFMLKVLLLTFVHCSSRTELARTYEKTVIQQEFLNSPKWLEGLHCFTQWQCSYKDASSLNHVLQQPLQFCSPAYLYNGKLALYFLSLDDISSVLSKLPNNEKGVYDQLLTTVLSHKSILNSMAPGSHTMHHTIN